MIAPLLALALAAHPVAPDSALLALHGSDLQQLRGFLQTAGSSAPTLTPGPLGRALGSALAIDALDPATWPEAGLDPSGPVSLLGFPDGASVLVLPVKDPAKVAARAMEGLRSAGLPMQKKAGGLTVVTAVVASTDARASWRGQVAISRTRAALWLGGGSIERNVEALSAKPNLARAKGLSGPITLVGSEAGGTFAAALTPSATALGIDARAQGKTAMLAPLKSDRFGALKPAGMLAARADLAPAALAEARGQLEALLRMLISRAGGPAVPDQLASALGDLAGPVALVVTGLDARRGEGSSIVDEYFLASHAYAAQVKDPARAKAALGTLTEALQNGKAALAKAPSPVPGLHRKLQVAPGRTFFFGLVDDVLYAANDLAARDALLPALAGAEGPVAHAGTLQLDGPQAALALGRLSILDAARSGPLAALFGLAIEGGPLLKASGTTTLNADPEPNGLRLRGTVNLAPPPAP